MRVMWTATIDNDASGTVIFEAPGDEIAGEVAKVIQEIVSSAEENNISMIAVIMRAEASHQTEGR